MNRTRSILAAGTLTGLILLTLLALGFAWPAAEDQATSAATTLQIEPPAPADAASANAATANAATAVQEWQAYSAELESAVRTLQQREAAYQSELQAANQTIETLQNEVNNAGTTWQSGGEYEDDEHEHEGYEYGEHAHDEEHEYDD